MSNEVDRYDVEAMIRDAVADLRGTIRDLERELRDAIDQERYDRQNADESLERVIASRTDHLV